MSNDEGINYLLKHEFAKLPVYQFSFPSPQELPFDESFRLYCSRRCKGYKTNWACPPAAGYLEKCHERYLTYDGCVVFSTISWERDAEDRTGKDPMLSRHEILTGQVDRLIEKQNKQTYILTSGKCTMCRKCTYPKDRCRHPELLRPCIESHGINIVELCEMSDMDYYLDENHRLKFSIVFYKNLTQSIR